MKKILVVSALALGLSSVAFAGGIAEKMPVAPVAAPAVVKSDFTPGIYVGVQGGYADSGFKSVVSGNPYNAGGGFVLIGDRSALTFATYNQDALSKDTGFAHRLFVGYDFHKNLSVELGHTYLWSKPTIKTTTTDTWTITTPNGTETGTDVTTSTRDFRMQVVDLSLKLKALIVDNFGLYAKAGPGYFMLKPSSGDSSNRFDFVYGVGAYYNITSNFAVDVSYTRFGSGQSKIYDSKWQPNVDFYAAGVSYKFDL